MAELTVFQTDRAGHFTGNTQAEESPLEPGVFMVPLLAVTTPPPATWPADKWPRWNGSVWQLVTKPSAVIDATPAAKLAAFLAANPDVQEMISNQ